MRNFFLKAIGLMLDVLITLQIFAQDIKRAAGKRAKPYIAKGLGYIMNNENEGRVRSFKRQFLSTCYQPQKCGWFFKRYPKCLPFTF